MIIQESQNFVEVYIVPRDRNRGFCFGGGHDIVFKQIDWFNAVPYEQIDKPIDWAGLREALTGFIRSKNYYNPDALYLVITHFHEAFFIRDAPAYDAVPEFARITELINEMVLDLPSVITIARLKDPRDPLQGTVKEAVPMATLSPIFEAIYARLCLQPEFQPYRRVKEENEHLRARLEAIPTPLSLQQLLFIQNFLENWLTQAGYSVIVKLEDERFYFRSDEVGFLFQMGADEIVETMPVVDDLKFYTYQIKPEFVKNLNATIGGED